MKCIELFSQHPDTWSASDVAAKELIFNSANAEPTLCWNNAANLSSTQKNSLKPWKSFTWHKDDELYCSCGRLQTRVVNDNTAHVYAVA